MIRMLKTASMMMVAALLAACGSTAQTAQPMGAPPPTPVSVAPAVEEAVPIQVKAFGTVEPFASVDVKSQVAGLLLSVRFTEGSHLNKGDLLFEIDPRPFQEALRAAEAAVTKDQAQLKLAEANLARDEANQRNVNADAERYAQLAREGIATRMQQDQVRTAADMARESVRADQAAIESMRAALDADRAAVEKAKLDLSYCQIRAPIAGRTGNLLVHAGNLVKVNDVPLVVIHQVSPIFVNFSVPEQHLGAIRRLSAAHKLAVRVFTQDNPDRFAQGELTVIDNTVDANTGTIHLKASFANRDGMLWPGQFVTVVFTLDTIQNATVIPTEAVQAGQQGQFVYVVTAENKAEMRQVATGRAFGKKTIV